MRRDADSVCTHGVEPTMWSSSLANNAITSCHAPVPMTLFFISGTIFAVVDEVAILAQDLLDQTQDLTVPGTCLTKPLPSVMDADPLQGPGGAWAKAGSSPLDDDSTMIIVQSVGPKQRESKAWHRFEKYKAATTVGEAIGLGAERSDFNSDLKVKVVTIMEKDGKRAPATGSPDRESAERAKTPNFSAAIVEVPTLPPIQRQTFTLDDINSLMEKTIRNEMTASRRRSRTRSRRSEGPSPRCAKRCARSARPWRSAWRQWTRAWWQWSVAAVALVHIDAVDDTVLIVRGFSRVTRDLAIETVTKALDEVAGFVEAFAEGMTPSIVKARFDTSQSLQTFPRSQSTVASFDGTNASRDEPVHKWQWNRTLNKIKRATIETTARDGKEVVVDRFKRQVFKVIGGRLQEIAAVDATSSITWTPDVKEDIKARTRELLTK